MRLTSIVSLSATLLLAAAAAAQGTTQAGTASTSAAQTAKPADAEKKICKRLAMSGTRMAERVCLTKQEWQKVEEEAK
jgi:Spy/CpxP family protein refolding chaperone